MVEDVDLGVVFGETQMVYQVVSPDDAHTGYTAEVASREVLLEFDAVVREDLGLAEVVLQTISNGPISPRNFGLPGEDKSDTPTIDHEEKACGQIDRVLQHLIFSRGPGRQPAAQNIFDGVSWGIGLDLASNVDNILVCPESNVAALIAQCIVTLLAEVLPVRVHL